MASYITVTSKLNDLMLIFNNYIKLLKSVPKIKLTLFPVDSETVIPLSNYIHVPIP